MPSVVFGIDVRFQQCVPFAAVTRADPFGPIVVITTPVNGIKDLYVRASYAMAATRIDKITGTIVYHDYRAERSARVTRRMERTAGANVDANTTLG